ncbi:4-phosphopantetheinyl transferase family protein [Mycoplasmopsis phocirhinis]|uniref:4-phosphopantetheinyl transferase family protein n=1 Tax=Mycoplasmopsis phocirhinis TaxID=142650 RepID=A0A4P6MLP1_9BACT|nr:4'-phosphopantetheinyl transferase superfamily protein [Mycoplasmopsis phocirhinis]QBF34388.1 4-phosphopantetheinyl transferase family protein [Mycoplasmopsis phocirhinis]
MKIGVDITSVRRFNNLSNGFIERYCHPNELKIIEKSKNKAKDLASIWAIKEALYKANNNLIEFSKIELIHSENGWYYKNNYSISTSNEGDLIVAFVLYQN